MSDIPLSPQEIESMLRNRDEDEATRLYYAEAIAIADCIRELDAACKVYAKECNDHRDARQEMELSPLPSEDATDANPTAARYLALARKDGSQ